MIRCPDSFWSDTVRYVPDKYFEIAGTAILVHHRGETTLPGSPPPLERGQTILFLHDAGANGNSFASVMDASAAGHSPVSFDFPGHGRSGSLDSLSSIEEFAQHAEDLLREWAVESLVVVGEGLGAAVGLELTQRPQMTVHALICIGAVGPDADLTEEIAELELITAGKARRNFDTSGYAPDPDEKMLREAFSQWVKTDPRATLGARRAQRAWNAEADLSDVGTPTLIVIGEHSEPASRESSEALARDLPDASIEVLPDAGRHGAIEQPRALAALIDRTISSLGLPS